MNPPVFSVIVAYGLLDHQIVLIEVRPLVGANVEIVNGIEFLVWAGAFDVNHVCGAKRPNSRAI